MQSSPRTLFCEVLMHPGTRVITLGRRNRVFVEEDVARVCCLLETSFLNRCCREA
jgi:hypothetical protein